MLIFFYGKAKTAQLNFPLFLHTLNLQIWHLYTKWRKKDKKYNYRPVNILPTLSKCFEKGMFCQISACLDEIFLKYQYSFRKGYSTQQCLLALLEKWKTAVDKGKVFRALLTDLAKALDCLNHELLIAKLNAYGFTLPTLKLLHDYLSDRKKRTRLNNSIVHGL